MVRSSFKRLNNYNLGIFFTSLIGGMLIIILGASGFFFEAWYLDVIVAASLFGALMSGVSYFTRLIDWWTTDTAENCSTLLSSKASGTKSSSLERVLTSLGLLFGAVITIVLILKDFTVPFINPLGTFIAQIIFFFRNVALFAGLGHRMSCPTAHRPTSEKKIIWGALLLGIFAVLAILASGGLPMLTALSVTTLFVGIPVANPLAIGIFILAYLSTWASVADYFSRAFNFFRFSTGIGGKNLAPEVRKEIEKRYHEYRGALVGIILGLIIAAVIMISIHPLSIVLGSTLILVSCSIFGGICGREGRFISGLLKKDETHEEPGTPFLQPTYEKVVKSTQGETQTKEYDESGVNFEMECSDEPTLPPPAQGSVIISLDETVPSTTPGFNP